MMQMPIHPTLPAPFTVFGVDIAVLTHAEDTAGAWEAIHQLVAPGGGSPLHTLAADKLFVLLEGALTFIIDGEEYRACAGASATVPAGVPHRFKNESERQARLLVVTSGGEHVAFLSGLAALAGSGGGDVAQHAARHGVTLLG